MKSDQVSLYKECTCCKKLLHIKKFRLRKPNWPKNYSPRLYRSAKCRKCECEKVQEARWKKRLQKIKNKYYVKL